MTWTTQLTQSPLEVAALGVVRDERQGAFVRDGGVAISAQGLMDECTSARLVATINLSRADPWIHRRKRGRLDRFTGGRADNTRNIETP